MCGESSAYLRLLWQQQERKQERPEPLGVGTDILSWRRSPPLSLHSASLYLFLSSFSSFFPLPGTFLLSVWHSPSAWLQKPPGLFGSSSGTSGLVCVGMETRRMRTAPRWRDCFLFNVPFIRRWIVCVPHEDVLRVLVVARLKWFIFEGCWGDVILKTTSVSVFETVRFF